MLRYESFYLSINDQVVDSTMYNFIITNIDIIKLADIFLYLRGYVFQVQAGYELPRYQVRLNTKHVPDQHTIFPRSRPVGSSVSTSHITTSVS